MNRNLLNDTVSVVSLHKKRKQLRGSKESAFDAEICHASFKSSSSGGRQVEDIVRRIVIDETLPFYIASTDGMLLHANARYDNLYASIDGINVTPGPVSMTGRASAPAMEKLCSDVIAANTTVKLQEHVTINGRNLVLLGRHIPVRDDNRNIIAIAGTYEDITQHYKNMQENARVQSRLQDFARASSDWFWECDASMCMTSLSERFTAIVGVPASFYIGSRFEQFGKFDYNCEDRNDGQYAMEHRKPFRDQLFIYTCHDEPAYRFHLSGVPVFCRSSGKFTGYRGVGVDVNQRYLDFEAAREARYELEDILAELTRKNMALDMANLQAQSALKVKSEFLASMSHELRTPLNAIIGFADTIKAQDTATRKQHVEYASNISDAGTHLLGLINDVLDAAVIESGELALNTEVVALDTVLQQGFNLTVAKAKEKSINVDQITLKSDLYIYVDHRRFLQIIVNLLSNAFKFTPEGGLVGLDIKSLGDTLSVIVRDTGVGIKSDDQNKIFDKFQQIVENPYSRMQEGTGLGLHISRELARRMGGDITVESQLGKGARFTVTVPLAEEQELPDEGGLWI